MLSRKVHSSQHGIHPSLEATVRKHCRTKFLRPIASHTARAFEEFDSAWRRAGSMPLVLDAGCGTGESSMHLALQRTECFVVGIDRSQHRLDKSTHEAEKGFENESVEHLPQNCLLLRADIVDFLLLACQHGIEFEQIYFLYPNPYPKPTHLQRRWHAHPVFPLLHKLTSSLELRTNWEIYAREFAQAGSMVGWSVIVDEYTPQQILTPFERKYHHSGHILWRLSASYMNTAKTD
jgi:tRNA G46 methylase TrmB